MTNPRDDEYSPPTRKSPAHGRAAVTAGMEASLGGREGGASIAPRCRRDAYYGLRIFLKKLAEWVRSRAPDAEAQRSPRANKYTVFEIHDRIDARVSRSKASHYIHIAVHLVRMLRDVRCSCPWEEKGHLSTCPRIAAMRWEEKLFYEYGITWTTDPEGILPKQMKELQSYEVVESDPDDPDVVPFPFTGTD